MPGVRAALLHAGPAAPPLPRHHQLRRDGVVVVEGGAVPRRALHQGGLVPGLDIAGVGVPGEHQHGLLVTH